MATGKWISWTPHKKKYDIIIACLSVLYIVTFSISHLLIYPTTLPPILIIKATGTLAFVMLIFILCIGPLSRINPHFIPLLYNRRHLGVSMFFISLIHGLLSLFFYHGSGIVNPIASLFTSNTHFDSFSQFPYMTLGFGALIIFCAMAITSHDYWNNRLGPKAWKSLHMMVYVAFILIILHISTGALQSDHNANGDLLLFVSIAVVIGLHLVAALKGWNLKRKVKNAIKEGKVLVEGMHEVINGRSKILTLNNQSIAIFKDGSTLHALENYCKHQGGPLGEGKIVKGCVTCPWHGYQYEAHNGTSPPPFHEQVPTYNLSKIGNQIWLDPTPNDLGVHGQSCDITPIAISEKDTFYIGWSSDYTDPYKKVMRSVVVTLFVFIPLLAFIVPRKMEVLKDSTYNFIEQKTYSGVIITEPTPMLRILENGNIEDHMLVAYGKKSALPIIESMQKSKALNLNGREATITVTEMQYQGRKVLELTNGIESFLELGELFSVNNQMQDLAYSDFTGEIVDPKCFFGAMNPGEGKVHRSCAALCLKGGIPAVLAAHTDSGLEYYIIKGTGGEDINESLLSYVSEKVKMKGQIKQLNNWKYLYLDNKENIKRLTFRNALGEDNQSLCFSDKSDKKL